MAPRHKLVKLVVNGRDLGIVHMEEHFSKEMLESNGRKDTLILKFDESDYWKSGKIFDYKNSRLVAFSAKRNLRDLSNKNLYDFFNSEYQKLLLEEINPSDIFDCSTWGRKIALDQLFGTVHGLRWSNLRFYANPYTLKLEPIGFDDAFNERDIK